MSATDATVDADLLATLPEIILAYVNAEGSNDPTAPKDGAPFVQGNPSRVYLQLEGRGGAGKDDDTFVATGLRPYILREWEAGNLPDVPGKNAIRNALIELGFVRKPFSYTHPDRGSSSASYYSIAKSDLTADTGEQTITVTLESRTMPERARSEGTYYPSVADDPIIPQMPEGDEADTARLYQLWDAYNASRRAVQRFAAEGYRLKPLPEKAALKRKAERDEEYIGLTAFMRERKEDLFNHRRTMHTKNQARVRATHDLDYQAV